MLKRLSAGKGGVFVATGSPCLGAPPSTVVCAPALTEGVPEQAMSVGEAIEGAELPASYVPPPAGEVTRRGEGHRGRLTAQPLLQDGFGQGRVSGPADLGAHRARRTPPGSRGAGDTEKREDQGDGIPQASQRVRVRSQIVQQQRAAVAKRPALISGEFWDRFVRSRQSFSAVVTCVHTPLRHWPPLVPVSRPEPPRKLRQSWCGSCMARAIPLAGAAWASAAAWAWVRRCRTRGSTCVSFASAKPHPRTPSRDFTVTVEAGTPLRPAAGKRF